MGLFKPQAGSQILLAQKSGNIKAVTENKGGGGSNAFLIKEGYRIIDFFYSLRTLIAGLIAAVKAFKAFVIAKDGYALLLGPFVGVQRKQQKAYLKVFLGRQREFEWQTSLLL